MRTWLPKKKLLISDHSLLGQKQVLPGLAWPWFTRFLVVQDVFCGAAACGGGSEISCCASLNHVHKILSLVIMILGCLRMSHDISKWAIDIYNICLYPELNLINPTLCLVMTFGIQTVYAWASRKPARYLKILTSTFFFTKKTVPSYNLGYDCYYAKDFRLVPGVFCAICWDFPEYLCISWEGNEMMIPSQSEKLVL